MSFRFGCSSALLVLFSVGARAQAPQASPTPRVLPSFYTTYTYTSYTVYDTTSDEPPKSVQGVGGTLTLRPSGAYEKRLSILMGNGLKHFPQNGQFTIKGDSIRFSFSDLRGSDVQRGTFRYNPSTRQLVITINGYPAGNKGVYELVGQKTKAK